jgi:ferric-dicitrate binding protein FerR (iron transport regulator)
MENKENISDELIFKVLSNEASESENKIFLDWFDSSPENKKIFLQIEQLWKESGGVGDYYKINQEQAWNNVYKNIAPKRRKQIIQPLLKVAAIIVMAYLLGGLTMYLVHKKPQDAILLASKEIHVKAPLGSKTEVELSDGTKVWLNSGSEVRYPAIFDRNQRDIYLVGEAYFDVEKNKECPFFVHTGEIDIKVLGTSFNVKSYPEEGLVETTLVEGLVNINKKGSSEKLELKPNEKATFINNPEKLSGNAGGQFTVTKDIDTELYVSWKSGKLIFKREKFKDLAIKLERWFNVHITVSNKKLTEERVTGIFQNESIEQALDALQISVPFTYKIDKNNITIR